MRFRKALASFAVLALISSAAVSGPAIAQDSDNNNDDASLWVAGIGIAGAAVLGIVLGTQHSNKEVHPVSP